VIRVIKNVKSKKEYRKNIHVGTKSIQGHGAKGNTCIYVIGRSKKINIINQTLAKGLTKLNKDNEYPKKVINESITHKEKKMKNIKVRKSIVNKIIMTGAQSSQVCTDCTEYVRTIAGIHRERGVRGSCRTISEIKCMINT
jgi:hypothetical protein